MLKHRIIPVLLTDGNGQCVKPVAFERPYRKLGTMEQYIRVIESRNVDELIIIDIEATAQKREPNFAKLRSWCDNLFCPVTYGGGVRTLDHIRLALENGADKVAIYTSAIVNPNFIELAANKYGSQCITVVCDTYKDHFVCSGFGPIAFCNNMKNYGAGEILLNSVDHDGTMDGYNINLIQRVCVKTTLPVVALGGCGEPAHMHQALAAGASAAAAGSMFLYTDHTPRSCALELAEWGNEVRL